MNRTIIENALKDNYKLLDVFGGKFQIQLFLKNVILFFLVGIDKEFLHKILNRNKVFFEIVVLRL